MGGDGKRSSRCWVGGGRKGARGLGSSQQINAKNTIVRRTLREAPSTRPPRGKKGKGSGRGEEGGGTQAKSMRARVSTYNCACMRACGVHLCFW